MVPTMVVEAITTGRAPTGHYLHADRRHTRDPRASSS
jgi:hypothetical protein